MEFKAVVRRGCFTTLKQNDLAIFTENVVLLTFGIKEYELVNNNADDLKVKFDIFKPLLLASLTDGSLAEKKRIAQKNLIAALHKLADGLDYFSNGKVAYIENAGMQPHKVRSYNINYDQVLEIPQVVGVLVSNKVPGDLDIELTKVEGANNYGFEYSEDGETWINGQYSSTPNATIKLPSRKELLVRARAIGTHDRKSDFCAPIKTFVL
jgi:hypothetical protein